MPTSNLQEFLVQWHLTERCNLSCRHCYQEGDRGDELSLTEIRETLSEISEMLAVWSAAYRLDFSPSFNITGGEPLLRRDLFEILEAIGAYGYDLYLLTNGTLINQENAAALAGLDVNGVQVSIEGPEEIHDSIRGRGSYAAGLQVTINATLSEMNASEFTGLVRIAESLGVQRLGFSRLVPSGRGLGLADRIIAPDRVKEIYHEIFAIPVSGLEIVTGDPVASQLRTGDDNGGDAGSVATGGCAAGVSGLTILPDGTLTPCRRLAVPIGNVRQDSLREIWAGSPVLEQLRDRRSYRGKCGSCPRWAGCRGCRAIAYAHSLNRGEGDILADDPQCFIAD